MVPLNKPITANKDVTQTPYYFVSTVVNLFF